jgi:hypothetical protein
VDSQFSQLQADFEYNLQLLQDRDSELQQYDGNAALQAAVLADNAQQLAVLQEACTEAQNGGWDVSISKGSEERQGKPTMRCAEVCMGGV